MHHKYLGKAIIFNRENPQLRYLKLRTATDYFNLEASLKNFGCDFTLYVYTFIWGLLNCF